MAMLAIRGGDPIRKELFPASNPIGEEEKRAVMAVMDSSNLSQYVGAWHPDFYGGPQVKAFEAAWGKRFDAPYVISMNSNTSGLMAAIGACNVGPGDEVIVSPYSMTASAIAPVVYGAVPVFADIDPETFCLDPKSIEQRITSRTKAILIVHLFGHPAEMNEVMAIARKHKLYVIEDCAQAPGATYHGKSVGTFGDIGIFSLNYHKHIHTGEGGMVTTRDQALAERLEVIRNHAEEVVDFKGASGLANVMGFNFRLTEVAAAIGIEQLKKLDGLLEERIRNADFLAQRIGALPGLEPAPVKFGCRHVYYVQAFKYQREMVGVPRDRFIDAIKAEIPTSKLRETTPIIGAGYVRPIYYQNFYQQRMGSCSFNCPRYQGEVRYEKGICPVAERMYHEELFKHEYMRPGMTSRDLDDVVRAFEKVYRYREELLEK